MAGEITEALQAAIFEIAISKIGDGASHMQSGSDITGRAAVSPSKTCSVVLTYARVVTGSPCKRFT